MTEPNREQTIAAALRIDGPWPLEAAIAVAKALAMGTWDQLSDMEILTYMTGARHVLFALYAEGFRLVEPENDDVMEIVSDTIERHRQRRESGELHTRYTDD